ncbi:sigma-54-dependent Fis family transcriptional regulator, partial [bacterium]|nr:sigma-54-dependent Fis family transcriptional regulator [bacterium]
RFSIKHRKKDIIVSQALIEHLGGYNWPGNIRELENCIERAIILKKSGPLSLSDLPLTKSELPPENGLEQPLNAVIDKIETDLIQKALKSTNWNYSKAANILGMTRQNLYYRLKKSNIRKEDEG